MNISFFNFPISNTLPRCRVTVKQIYKYIISGRAKEKTQLLRSLVDGGVRRAYKAQNLDYVTFSGCFSVRKIDGLISHSGFMCFDIDHIDSEERLQEIKSNLINDELLHTVLCFRSPSGNGLKWVVEVPDRYWLRVVSSPTDDTDCSDSYYHDLTIRSLASQEVARRIDTDFTPSECLSFTDDRVQIIDVIVGNHRMLYERIRGYLFERYGIETDYTSDIARPCYLCHDDDAYYDEPTFHSNPASRFLIKNSVRENSTSIASSNLCNLWETKTNKNKKNYENDIEKIVRDIEHRSLDITDDYHNWMLVAMALAGTYGSAGEGYFHRISQYSSKYDNKEAHRMYQSCLRNNNGLVGIGTIVYLMKN